LDVRRSAFAEATADKSALKIHVLFSYRLDFAVPFDSTHERLPTRPS
jgi:hypothetical protein